jgi:hypothetical protein
MTPNAFGAGIAIGGLLALLINVVRTVRYFSSGSPGTICSGPWTARLTDGSERMSLFQRAVVSLTGLWAMRSSEAIYFTALHDSDGARLNSSCRYEIHGNKLPARWWSVTVYQNCHFIPNKLNRYSRSSTNIQRNDDNLWVITLSEAPSETNWIPLTSGPGVLSVTLRLYGPQQGAFSEQEETSLPTIRRV